MEESRQDYYICPVCGKHVEIWRRDHICDLWEKDDGERS